MAVLAAVPVVLWNGCGSSAWMDLQPLIPHAHTRAYACTHAPMSIPVPVHSHMSMRYFSPLHSTPLHDKYNPYAGNNQQHLL